MDWSLSFFPEWWASWGIKGAMMSLPMYGVGTDSVLCVDQVRIIAVSLLAPYLPAPSLPAALRAKAKAATQKSRRAHGWLLLVSPDQAGATVATPSPSLSLPLPRFVSVAVATVFIRPTE